mmetsp:Transcript_70850/g.189168  ORF Transcript_70850/g.189168 Transcript_70850/m.189168 type:complete len:84 (-) Transcript_70850:282-533(-)
MGTINFYTSWLLIELSRATGVPSYEELVRRILGRKWYIVYFWCNILLLFGSACVQVQSVKDLGWITIQTLQLESVRRLCLPDA